MQNFVELNEYIKLSGFPNDNEPIYKEVADGEFEMVALFDKNFRKANMEVISGFHGFDVIYLGQHYVKMHGDGMYN